MRWKKRENVRACCAALSGALYTAEFLFILDETEHRDLKRTEAAVPHGNGRGAPGQEVRNVHFRGRGPFYRSGDQGDHRTQHQYYGRGRGLIFASTDPERIGQRHLGACQVLEQGLPRLVVQEDDGRPGGARRGINLPIQLDGQTVGVIGITGAPQEVESLGSVIKRMTEIMVRDTRRQEQEELMDSARACFIENWLFAEEPDLTELELRGNMLGIDVTARWSVVILEVMAPPVPESPQEMRTALYLKHIRPYLPDRDRGLCAVINQRILLIFRTGIGLRSSLG